MTQAEPRKSEGPGIDGKMTLLEVAVASLEDAIVAEASGAQRLELNAAMPLGGLTPSAGLVKAVLEAVETPVIAMVRPRPGGFTYDRETWRVCLREAEWLLETGVAGIACGPLLPDRTVDLSRSKELRRLVGDREWVFHRAFDLTPDWRVALETLIDSDCHRVLSSGQRRTALEGLTCLTEMQATYGHRIEILPGSGIRPESIAPLFSVGFRQFHGTFSRVTVDPGYADGPFRFSSEDDWRTVDQDAVRAARQTLEDLLAREEPGQDVRTSE